MTQEDYRDVVVEGARKRLQNESWFGGVCTDHVMDHYPDVDKGVEAVVLDTFYWDGEWW